MSWVDRWLGELLTAVEETGLAENTAVLLTSDHGAHLAERGSFGKSYPVQEAVGRTPFMVRMPGGGSGRSQAIVQPQDVFATVAKIAGVDVPEDLESFDVMQAARGGGDGERRLALTGCGADGWGRRTGDILFTAFDREWCIEVAAKPEDCRLTRLGTLVDVASRNAGLVSALHAAAIDKVERRGADPALVTWLRSQGEGGWPRGRRSWDGYPGPAGFQAYFQRLYLDGES